MATTLVSPPDGDMGDYFKSLKKMLLRDDNFYIPSHGSIIKNPQKFIKKPQKFIKKALESHLKSFRKSLKKP